MGAINFVLIKICFFIFGIIFGIIISTCISKMLKFNNRGLSCLIISLITAVAFLMIESKFNISFEFFKYSILLLILVVMSTEDFYTMTIYNEEVVIGVICSVVLFVFEGVIYRRNVSYFMYKYILFSLIIGILILIFILLIGGMGIGDLEVYVMCSLFLGLKLSLIMIFLSFVIGGIFGFVLIAAKLRTKKDRIPFIPFIAVSSIIVILQGQNLLDWYMRILNL